MAVRIGAGRKEVTGSVARVQVVRRREHKGRRGPSQNTRAACVRYLVRVQFGAVNLTAPMGATTDFRTEVPVPRIKSAKKRMRQTKTRTARNKAQRSQLRNAVKKVRTAATGAEALLSFATAEQLLDRAARKRLVHPNTAARQKSRLAKAAKAK